MNKLKLNRLQSYRILCYVYLIGICLFWIIGNGFSGYWPFIIIVSLLVIQIFTKIPLADGILGFILGLLAFYMLLAATSDLVDHFNGTKPVKTFFTYFGTGYAIYGVTFLCAGTLIYASYKKLLSS